MAAAAGVVVREVKLRAELLKGVGVREWGMPTGLYVGKMFRSEKHETITCGLPLGHDRIRWQTRYVRIVERAEDEWMPASWRDAAWRYVQQWPASGHYLTPFLRITLEQRRAFVRELIVRAMSAVEKDDPIGWMAQGRGIGIYATEYPRVGGW